MTIDRADWHYGGKFPEGLPIEAGGTHIGFYLAWIINNNLISEFHTAENSREIDQVKSKKMSGRDFLFQICDEKFMEEDLNQEGILFTKTYYDDRYLSDLIQTFNQTIYLVEDTWQNYDKIALKITQAYEKWKQKSLPLTQRIKLKLRSFMKTK